MSRRRKPGFRARQRPARDRLPPIIEQVHDGMEWIRLQQRRFLARRQLRKEVEAERDLDMRKQINVDIIEKRRAVYKP
jgi:hypothetical protein